MPDLTAGNSSRSHSQNVPKPSRAVSRQMVIETGMNSLYQIGSEHICKVCVSNGGSCCSGCRHLSNRTGCQLRNTSCTAWLCGFLKYVLYETGLLEEWNDYWDQVPGKDYREDYTPEVFFVQRSLSMPDLRELSEALASDLKDLTRAQLPVGYILTLREKLDHNIDKLLSSRHDPRKQSRLKRANKLLSCDFHRFHEALRDYRERHPIS